MLCVTLLPCGVLQVFVLHVAGAASAVAALTGGPGPAADAAAAPGLAAGARRGTAANAHQPSLTWSMASTARTSMRYAAIASFAAVHDVVAKSYTEKGSDVGERAVQIELSH